MALIFDPWNVDMFLDGGGKSFRGAEIFKVDGLSLRKMCWTFFTNNATISTQRMKV